jgi:hypothetical protein
MRIPNNNAADLIVFIFPFCFYPFSQLILLMFLFSPFAGECQDYSCDFPAANIAFGKPIKIRPFCCTAKCCDVSTISLAAWQRWQDKVQIWIRVPREC